MYARSINWKAWQALRHSQDSRSDVVGCSECLNKLLGLQIREGPNKNQQFIDIRTLMYFIYLQRVQYSYNTWKFQAINNLRIA